MAYLGLQMSAVTSEQRLFLYQLKRIGLLALAAAGVGIVVLLFPNFFQYRYFTWAGWESVARFWPMFAWCIGLNLLVVYFSGRGWPIRAGDNRELLKWEIITSTLAGIWEEIGYRWAFICYAMIGIAITNGIFGAGLGWILVVAFLIGSFVAWKQKEPLIAASAFGGASISALFALYANPVYWFYQFLVWVMHFTTFTLMDPVFYGGHETLLIFGAVVANLWFRDGHKYQGVFGLVNSWYCGMVLLYATVVYGLWTAIAVHALYDIAISLFRFLAQKTR